MIAIFIIFNSSYWVRESFDPFSYFWYFTISTKLFKNDKMPFPPAIPFHWY